MSQSQTKLLLQASQESETAWTHLTKRPDTDFAKKIWKENTDVRLLWQATSHARPLSAFFMCSAWAPITLCEETRKLVAQDSPDIYSVTLFPELQLVGLLRERFLPLQCLLSRTGPGAQNQYEYCTQGSSCRKKKKSILNIQHANTPVDFAINTKKNRGNVLDTEGLEKKWSGRTSYLFIWFLKVDRQQHWLRTWPDEPKKGPCHWILNLREPNPDLFSMKS